MVLLFEPGFYIFKDLIWATVTTGVTVVPVVP